MSCDHILSTGFLFLTWGTPYRHSHSQNIRWARAGKVATRGRRLQYRQINSEAHMTDSNHWVDILSQEELDGFHEMTANLDPSFAAGARKFWESRTESDLTALANQAWLTNDGDQYQLARSYLAVAKAREDFRP
jgi:hypothetical protein